jgi:hypothetical protein
MRLMNKNFRLILDAAARIQVPTPVTAAAFQMSTAVAAGSTEEDFPAVIRLAENLARWDSHRRYRPITDVKYLSLKSKSLR